MNGEFKVLVKKYDANKLISAFGKNFTENLSGAYSKSGAKSDILKESDFCFGYLTNDSLFLIYNREERWMRVYIESIAVQSVRGLQDAINRYFESITRMLDREKISWNDPQATISLENYPLYGSYKTRWQRSTDFFKEKKEKLFVIPIASFIVSFLLIHYRILTGEDAKKNMLETLTVTAEAYIGVILVLIFQFLLVPNKRKFIFNF